ncbi:MAG: DUF2807 domain-containing protein [Prolixibacteraceae bacterium]|nr:DUF2807 domain-containing protein [Prolixibacteraceae bacterium]MBN2775769.1 DUF2807 domain-containing protein [Prolixibacteraceae bacterium]
MKTIKLIFLSISVFLLLFSTSCIDEFSVRGNGIENSETRFAQNFSKVKSSGAFDIHISNSDEYEVVVNAETNILPYIETEVNGNTLYISIRGLHNVRNTLPMEVYISTPVLEEIKQSGSGEIISDFFESNNFDVAISGSGYVETAVDCHKFDVTVSGSGQVYVSGVADYSDIHISGSGNVDAFDLYSKDCNANISGSGDIYTNVDRLLDVSISGSGNVYYIGYPSINSHISGSGKVISDN